MKGSPIISTLLAAIIMVSIYLIMHTRLASNNSSEPDHTSRSKTKLEDRKGESMVSAYIEVHFSTPPASFTIYHPVSNQKIVEINDHSDNEWSDEILIPEGDSIELNVVAKWKDSDDDRQHFVQLILSPNGKDDASTTLRSMTDIDTTATFTWASSNF